MNWLGLDIGGANLKVADGRGYARSVAFPLWRHPERLAERLRSLVSESPPVEGLAITMTGELADGYASKSEGVAAIVQAAEEAAEGRPTGFYSTDGQFLCAATATDNPTLVASANWHALARFAARFVDGRGLLVDMGSTTTDIIPLVDGQPQSLGLTDVERLIRRELVYTGVWRTPVASVIQSVPWRDQDCPVAAEWFATMLDVYLTLGEISERRESTDTADGRPATAIAACSRLARMLCLDHESFSREDAAGIARFVADRQQQQIRSALETVLARLPRRPQTIVAAGQGEFLVDRVAREVISTARVRSLADELGTTVSECAPAHAVAVLAGEWER